MPHVAMYIPSKDDLAGWVMLLNEARWMDIDSVIHLHTQLHAQFGDKPNDAVLEGERLLSNEMRSWGIEHRHKDALADAAGTTVENPAAATLEEVMYYLESIPVHSGIVKIMQGVDSPTPLFAVIDESTLPDGMGKMILKQMNKMMPPGVVIKAMPKKPQEEFAREQRAYDLELDKVHRRDVMTVPWKQSIDSAPATVLKEDVDGQKSIAVELTVMKRGADTLVDDAGRPYRYMLGPVLKPEVEDTQGQIYSHEEVYKGCHWWAEHSRVLSLQHVLMGGRILGDDEMVMVENYILPLDWEYEESKVLKAGTWMMGARAYGRDAISAVDAGQLNTWSIGADTLACVEEVAA
jgi:hypothetical protein